MTLGHSLPLPEPPFSQKQKGKSHPSGEEVMTKPGEPGLLKASAREMSASVILRGPLGAAARQRPRGGEQCGTEESRSRL